MASTAPPVPKPREGTATIPPVIGRPSTVSPEDLLEELDLEPAPEEAAPEPPRNPRTTLITGKKETEDLRRRIGMPAELEVNLDEVQTHEDLEEMSFEVDPLSGLDTLEEAEPPPPPSPPPPPPAPRAMAPPLGNGPERSAPVVPPPVRPKGPATVTIEVEPGQGEVTVPIEIGLEPGDGPITLNLKIVLRSRH